MIDRIKKILAVCLGVKQGETVLIVTDDVKKEIGTLIYQASREMGAETILLEMQAGAVSGQEPPALVAAAMQCADVVICPTDKSLTHTNARISAVANGARIATMPGITMEMFSRGAMCADYEEVGRLTKKVAGLLTEAKTARIVKDGYVLSLELHGRRGISSTGLYRRKGQAGNLPSGEAYIAPREHASNGEMIIDGSMVGLGKLNGPLYLRVADGMLREMKGEGAEKLRFLFQTDENRTLGELGIGTNKEAILCGIILEDEKVYGTVHIAFGTNTSFGGANKAQCHVDGVILAPDLYLDDNIILNKGIFADSLLRSE